VCTRGALSFGDRAVSFAATGPDATSTPPSSLAYDVRFGEFLTIVKSGHFCTMRDFF